MIYWIAFLALIILLLALDLGVFHKDGHVVSTREALGWTSVWVSLSLLFSGFVFLAYSKGWAENVNGLSGEDAFLKYLTGYLVEQSLSMDNIFVIVAIFAYFKIPPAYQHRVLFWGIIGAIVFRGIMILVGVVLIKRYSWIIYIFGAFLLYSAYKMFTSIGEHVQLSRNPVIKFIKRFFPVSKHLDGEHFFIRRRHILAATPLFVALVVVETTDIVFAFDSIPAIFAITTDPFLVFTSNIFAILGLRSLYFVLASIIQKFRFMKYSLVFILGFVGVKLLLLHYVHFPEWLSLAVIATALTTGLVVSLLLPHSEEEAGSEKARDQAIS